MSLGRTFPERVAAVAPFVGKLCTVTYRRGPRWPYDTTAVGIVHGAAYHLTNGNSTGDLVLGAPGGTWRMKGADVAVASIALCHVDKIEEGVHRG